MVKYTVGEIAEQLNGVVEGDPSIVITDVCKIEEGAPDKLSFLSNMAYEPYLYTTKCGAVLVNKDLRVTHEVQTTLIRVEDAYMALAKLMQIKARAERPQPGISDRAIVHPSAQISPKAHIAPFCMIEAGVVVEDDVIIHPLSFVGEGAKIGAGSVLYQHAIVCAGTVVGERCIIHSSAVIGADGFGFAPSKEGYIKIPQRGNVVLEDDVEVGANACIDRAVIGSTIIHTGVKIDNLVQVAHNSEIGAHTVMAAQSGVAGSVHIGEWNSIGGQVGITGHKYTANRVTLAAQSGVVNDIKEEGITMFGSPAKPFTRAMKSAVLHDKLPDMAKELSALRRELNELKALVDKEGEEARSKR